MSQADTSLVLSQNEAPVVRREAVPPLRIAAVVTLAASAGLLLTGRRKAGVAVAAVGTALAVMEDPKTVNAWWMELPILLGKSQQMLERAEHAVEEFSARGEQLRGLLNRFSRRS